MSCEGLLLCFYFKTNEMDAQKFIEEFDEEMPLELMEHVKAAKLETLPVKSREKYNRVYEKFKTWQTNYGVETVSSIAE